jgi:hypothetical protein
LESLELILGLNKKDHRGENPLSILHDIGLSLYQLLHRLPKLTQLKLGMMPSCIPSSLFIAIPWQLPSLIRLELSCIEINYFPDLNLCHQLQELTILWTGESIPTKKLESSIKSLKSLNKLDIQFVNEVTDVDPLSCSLIQSLSPSLRILHLRPYQASQGLLVTCLQHCPLLRELTISVPYKCPSWIVSLFLVTFKLLTRLEVTMSAPDIPFDMNPSSVSYLQLESMRNIHLSSTITSSGGSKGDKHDDIVPSEVKQPHHQRMIHDHLIEFSCDLVDNLLMNDWSFPKVDIFRLDHLPLIMDLEPEELESANNWITLPMPFLSFLNWIPRIKRIGVSTVLLSPLPLSLSDIARTMSRPITHLTLNYCKSNFDAIVQLLAICHTSLKELVIYNGQPLLLLRLFGMPSSSYKRPFPSSSSATRKYGKYLTTLSSPSFHSQYPLTQLNRLSLPRAFDINKDEDVDQTKKASHDQSTHHWYYNHVYSLLFHTGYALLPSLHTIGLNEPIIDMLKRSSDPLPSRFKFEPL